MDTNIGAECPINRRIVEAGILSALVIILAHVVAFEQAGAWIGLGSPPHDRVVLWRAIFSLWATVALLTPALCFFIWLRSGPVETYARAFWTFAYVAFLFHLWWAIFGICQGNFNVIFWNQTGRLLIPACRVEHPWLDSALAVIWGVDVALLWTVRLDRTWFRRFTGFVLVLTFVMFVMALMEKKASVGAHRLAMVMAGVVLTTYAARVAFRAPDPKSFGVFVFVTLYRIINRIVVWRRLVWHRMPLLFAIGNLDALREVLRAKNLHDTSGIPVSNPAGRRQPVPYSPAYLHSREPDGWFNDLGKPSMGGASINDSVPAETSDFTRSDPGARFGRNIPLSEVGPERDGGLLDPNPRDISNVLLARKPGTFVPATTLNLLAAAWIQFQVHDWFNHGTPVTTDPIDVPTRPGDEKLVCPMRIRRTRPDPTRKPNDGNGPVTYVNAESHWWDGSQIYGSSTPGADRLRERRGGRLELDVHGLIPVEANGLERTGLTANWWIGLSLMHNLFVKEHNAICDHLAREYPGWDDDQLYRVARLVNVALMAKIHTLEWTPAILGHPVLQVGMKGNWWGFAGERIKKALGRISEGELVSGIPGSATDHHGADYCLTEEFVSVYRMHALMPDHIDVHSLVDRRPPTRFTLDADRDPDHVNVVGPGARDRALRAKIGMEDLLYSFGRTYPGALVLHNYPEWMRRVARRRSNGTVDEYIDLAAVDIVRDRERGVPRYNRFRRLMHLRPRRSFAELTSNAVWADELEKAYGGDVEKVDLMVGMYAEDKPYHFGISDTAFRVFLLMASRRLKSDRFFTKDYTPEVYTQAGIDWVEHNTMRTVLLRHYPALAPALYDVKNPFGGYDAKNPFGALWNDVWKPPRTGRP